MQKLRSIKLRQLQGRRQAVPSNALQIVFDEIKKRPTTLNPVQSSMERVLRLFAGKAFPTPPLHPLQRLPLLQFAQQAAYKYLLCELVLLDTFPVQKDTIIAETTDGDAIVQISKWLCLVLSTVDHSCSSLKIHCHFNLAVLD